MKQNRVSPRVSPTSEVPSNLSLITPEKKVLPSKIDQNVRQEIIPPKNVGTELKPDQNAGIDKTKMRITDFARLGKLGEGATGKVYHVINKNNGEQFALKEFNKKDLDVSKISLYNWWVKYSQTQRNKL